jgi:spermidine dehydrogenase
MSKHRDRELGMFRNITRRDFLNGIAVSAAASLVPDWAWANSKDTSNYYPPALTGLRGSHKGSFETAHSLRDGTLWEQAGKPDDTGEKYDLVIVGGGLSGLSAAHFYRKVAGTSSKILILDNHDDFGGHAKRNEFTAGSRTMLGFGGTFSIESPAPYSPVARGLVEELGIDVPSYSKYLDPKIYSSRNLQHKIFFDKETFGVDRLLSNPTPLIGGETDANMPGNEAAWKAFFAEVPISDQAKKDFARLAQENTDFFPSLSVEDKKARLARMSYGKYLKDVVGVHEDVLKIYQAGPHPLFGLGIDAVAAQDAWGLGFPGFEGLKLGERIGNGMNRDARFNEVAEKYFFHFPDGNASIARLLVRKLIPEAIPGNSYTDIVTAKANYARLDESPSAVRIRLNSTVVRVKHLGDPQSSKEVEVTYSTSGKLRTLRAANCVLACWHVVIPYICEELPDRQKEALASAQKVPLLYTNVAIKNWTSFEKLGVRAVYAPGSYHTSVNLDLPVSMGGYQCSQAPDEPVVVHMVRTPNKPGLPGRQQHTVGRIELYGTAFETMERKIRDQLTRMLGGGGFDPARDIMAITVNRWPHGYAYEYNSLWDPFWLEGGELPCEVARKPHGRIAIANSDAGAYAYTDGAIDQAYRAIQELTAKG